MKKILFTFLALAGVNVCSDATGYGTRSYSDYQQNAKAAKYLKELYKQSTYYRDDEKARGGFLDRHLGFLVGGGARQTSNMQDAKAAKISARIAYWNYARALYKENIVELMKAHSSFIKALNDFIRTGDEKYFDDMKNMAQHWEEEEHPVDNMTKYGPYRPNYGRQQYQTQHQPNYQ